ncbi:MULTISPECIES: hypothetical protein [unclassified Arcicella]|uniref:hypothetical protein n=1 Tax=unclassified Arcicella TaxID=2644986 RepID=UPI0028659AB5|nr:MULTISPECIES: hypothetical protein [unclassified Arcicella]MDR6561260.1 hypothetical protein [Arcicella sp. BE51]MDR6811144.1 hypothetical protein [Arcicella sp. BE140]MDR6822494.1 hypothetical protein [Arcicella sp. BE139]
MSKKQYIGARASVWMYRIIFFVFVLLFMIESVFFFISDLSVYIYLISIIGLMFFMNINSISYNEKNIYICNYKGKKTYLRSVDFSIEPIVFFLDFYWVKFSETNEKYLFSPQIGQIFGTTDSGSTAKEIEKMLKTES